MNRPQTLADFLNQDLDTLIERNTDIAAMYKALLVHTVDRAEQKRKYHIEFSHIQCSSEGDCKLTVKYID